MAKYDLMCDIVFSANDDEQAQEIVRGIIATLTDRGHEVVPTELYNTDDDPDFEHPIIEY